MTHFKVPLIFVTELHVVHYWRNVAKYHGIFDGMRSLEQTF